MCFDPIVIYTGYYPSEIKEQLASSKLDDKKDALKKVIALMTIEKDVSKLFIDIVNCMQQGDIEMKKLVYLYLINYADQKPDLALLAVQSFIRVCFVLLKS